MNSVLKAIAVRVKPVVRQGVLASGRISEEVR
jgi:hypothetical protein